MIDDDVTEMNLRVETQMGNIINACSVRWGGAIRTSHRKNWSRYDAEKDR